MNKHSLTRTNSHVIIPYSLTHSHTHTLTHSLTHSHTHSLSHLLRITASFPRFPRVMQFLIIILCKHSLLPSISELTETTVKVTSALCYKPPKIIQLTPQCISVLK